MRHYEVMVILEPNLEESQVSPTLDKFLKGVKDAGGAVDKIDVWGRRRLAYEINKSNEGVYAVVDLQSEPGPVAEMDRQMRLSESVLRAKVLRPELR
ncbi:30S ribosomal protein S6 [Glycomyces harbinensis]|uniref:Small ribosomal subunit protein bS6 n=1 Tax=Glycomyces harbinensis TaxID=58114 RepID=A0A1G6W4M9_9ACTN|nr:30S ribosomal protein S6 [Glycomyces harbinensis]SDD60890.1 small subunit ribosomal protein S6 [Glycomyces harbinensis]